MIRVRCDNPTCGQQMQALEELAGKRIRCPKCGQSLPVPTDDPVVATQDMTTRGVTPLHSRGNSPPDAEASSRDAGWLMWIAGGVGVCMLIALLLGGVGFVFFVSERGAFPVEEPAMPHAVHGTVEVEKAPSVIEEDLTPEAVPTSTPPPTK